MFNILVIIKLLTFLRLGYYKNMNLGKVRDLIKFKLIFETNGLVLLNN